MAIAEGLARASLIVVLLQITLTIGHPVYPEPELGQCLCICNEGEINGKGDSTYFISSRHILDLLRNNDRITNTEAIVHSHKNKDEEIDEEDDEEEIDEEDDGDEEIDDGEDVVEEDEERDEKRYKDDDKDDDKEDEEDEEDDNEGDDEEDVDEEDDEDDDEEDIDEEDEEDDNEEDDEEDDDEEDDEGEKDVVEEDEEHDEKRYKDDDEDDDKEDEEDEEDDNEGDDEEDDEEDIDEEDDNEEDDEEDVDEEDDEDEEDIDEEDEEDDNEEDDEEGVDEEDDEEDDEDEEDEEGDEEDIDEEDEEDDSEEDDEEDDEEDEKDDEERSEDDDEEDIDEDDEEDDDEEDDEYVDEEDEEDDEERYEEEYEESDEDYEIEEIDENGEDEDEEVVFEEEEDEDEEEYKVKDDEDAAKDKDDEGGEESDEEVIYEEDEYDKKDYEGGKEVNEGYDKEKDDDDGVDADEEVIYEEEDEGDEEKESITLEDSEGDDDSDKRDDYATSKTETRVESHQSKEHTDEDSAVIYDEYQDGDDLYSEGGHEDTETRESEKTKDSVEDGEDSSENSTDEDAEPYETVEKTHKANSLKSGKVSLSLTPEAWLKILMREGKQKISGKDDFYESPSHESSETKPSSEADSQEVNSYSDPETSSREEDVPRSSSEDRDKTGVSSYPTEGKHKEGSKEPEKISLSLAPEAWLKMLMRKGKQKISGKDDFYKSPIESSETKPPSSSEEDSQEVKSYYDPETSSQKEGVLKSSSEEKEKTGSPSYPTEERHKDSSTEPEKISLSLTPEAWLKMLMRKGKQKIFGKDDFNESQMGSSGKKPPTESDGYPREKTTSSHEVYPSPESVEERIFLSKDKYPLYHEGMTPGGSRSTGVPKKEISSADRSENEIFSSKVYYPRPHKQPIVIDQGHTEYPGEIYSSADWSDGDQYPSSEKNLPWYHRKTFHDESGRSIFPYEVTSSADKSDKLEDSDEGIPWPHVKKHGYGDFMDWWKAWGVRPLGHSYWGIATTPRGEKAEVEKQAGPYYAKSSTSPNVRPGIDSKDCDGGIQSLVTDYDMQTYDSGIEHSFHEKASQQYPSSDKELATFRSKFAPHQMSNVYSYLSKYNGLKYNPFNYEKYFGTPTEYSLPHKPGDEGGYDSMYVPLTNKGNYAVTYDVNQSPTVEFPGGVGYQNYDVGTTYDANQSPTTEVPGDVEYQNYGNYIVKDDGSHPGLVRFVAYPDISQRHPYVADGEVSTSQGTSGTTMAVLPGYNSPTFHSGYPHPFLCKCYPLYSQRVISPPHANH